MPKISKVVLIAVLVSFVSVLAVSAQSATVQATAEASESEAAQLVAQAWTDFTQLESYNFTYNSTVSSTLKGKDDQTIGTTTIYAEEGVVVGANSDTQFAVKSSSSSGNVTQEAGNGAELSLERVVVNGTTYLQLETKDTVYEGLFPVADGWWRYDDLHQALNDSTIALALDTFVKLPLPDELPFSADLITSVTELDGDTIDGKPMRVFDVELNALKILIQQSPVTGTDRLTQLVKEADLLAASHLSATMRLWIGADDGLVYQAQGHSETALPYLSTGHGDELPYDTQSSSDLSFTITVPDKPAAISAPTDFHTSD